MRSATLAPPSEDKRWRLVDATMRRHGHSPNALIETLHTVQESFGYLEDDALRYVAKSLHVPMSRVYGVATFYYFFSLKPAGEHRCVVCLGTACYIKGGKAILDTISEMAGIKPGQTTPDGRLSLLTVRCVGSCGLAPAVVFDDEVKGRVTPPEAIDRVKDWF
ncbi:MAG: bidirectional hydrogenase complex protein HoxE [Anaerolineae bacterium]|nr:bidirectional hydrogenase complex protein HoxE [Anaerolineae bacterium]